MDWISLLTKNLVKTLDHLEKVTIPKILGIQYILNMLKENSFSIFRFCDFRFSNFFRVVFVSSQNVVLAAFCSQWYLCVNNDLVSGTTSVTGGKCRCDSDGTVTIDPDDDASRCTNPSGGTPTPSPGTSGGTPAPGSKTQIFTSQTNHKMTKNILIEKLKLQWFSIEIVSKPNIFAGGSTDNKDKFPWWLILIIVAQKTRAVTAHTDDWFSISRADFIFRFLFLVYILFDFVICRFLRRFFSSPFLATLSTVCASVAPNLRKTTASEKILKHQNLTFRKFELKFWWNRSKMLEFDQNSNFEVGMNPSFADGGQEDAEAQHGIAIGWWQKFHFLIKIHRKLKILIVRLKFELFQKLWGRLGVCSNK